MKDTTVQQPVFIAIIVVVVLIVLGIGWKVLNPGEAKPVSIGGMSGTRHAGATKSAGNSAD